jgi:arsenate reductase (glutaredoxin)
LTAKGVDYQAINYFTEPLSVNALKQLLRSAGLRPQDALRTNEEAYRQFVAARDLSDDEIVRIMADHPELIQRPIVARGDKAVLARPVDRLAKLGIEYPPNTDPWVQPNDRFYLDIWLTRGSIEHTPVCSRRTVGGFQ